MAFIRKKKVKGKFYYYIVESQMVDGKCKQRVLAYLGTAEALLNRLKEGEKNGKKRDAKGSDIE